MAEKKEHKIVSASTGKATTVKQAAPVGNAGSKRAGAWILWILALVCEVVAILAFMGKIILPKLPTLYWVIGLMVVDFIFAVIANRLWIKANHIDPASGKNKAKFFLNNNLGLIMTVICFLPLLILILLNKDADKKTKTIATAVAAGLLVIGGLTGIDFNPISEEEKAAAQVAFGEQNVYWTKFGGVYHTSEDCSHLNRSDELTVGTVEQAVAESKTRLCKTCAKKDGLEDKVKTE